MNNPYTAPEADLSLGEDNRRKVGWKIFFIFMLPLEIWSQYDAFTVNEYGDSIGWRILSLLVYTNFMVGLFGLAFNKKILSAKYWLSFLPVFILFDFFDLIPWLLDKPVDLTLSVVILVILLPLVFFSWYSIYKYGNDLRKI